MRDTRLVFVEGVLGAGKSTLVSRLLDRLAAQGIAAQRVNEADERLRVASQLAHGYTPWLDISVRQYVARCQRNWQAFASAEVASGLVTVCDGLLFHGNLTDLVMMQADAAALAAYYEMVLRAVAPLRPSLIYLRPRDVAATLRDICRARGSAWETRQVNWKVASPYGRAHGYAGVDGLTRLYEDFARTCDTLVAGHDLPTLRSFDDREWADRERDIDDWLEI